MPASRLHAAGICGNTHPARVHARTRVRVTVCVCACVCVCVCGQHPTHRIWRNASAWKEKTLTEIRQSLARCNLTRVFLAVRRATAVLPTCTNTTCTRHTGRVRACAEARVPARCMIMTQTAHGSWICFVCTSPLIWPACQCLSVFMYACVIPERRASRLPCWLARACTVRVCLGGGLGRLPRLWVSIRCPQGRGPAQHPARRLQVRGHGAHGMHQSRGCT